MKDMISQGSTKKAVPVYGVDRDDFVTRRRFWYSIYVEADLGPTSKHPHTRLLLTRRRRIFRQNSLSTRNECIYNRHCWVTFVCDLWLLTDTFALSCSFWWWQKKHEQTSGTKKLLNTQSATQWSTASIQNEMLIRLTTGAYLLQHLEHLQNGWFRSLTLVPVWSKDKWLKP